MTADLIAVLGLSKTTKAINKAAPDFSQKFLIVATVFFWVVSFRYYTPEKTKELLDYFALYNITPSYDWPTIIPLALFIWMLIGLIDATHIHLKVISDVAMAEGMDGCESCVTGKLHRVGDWGWIRVGGTKTFPIPGQSIWTGLLTHIHIIGTHIVFEGRMTPNTVLDYLPFEIKQEARQRKTGLFGVTNCSVGYIAAGELGTHKEFEKKEYKDVIDPDEYQRLPDVINTAEFINAIAINNSTLDLGLQLINHEHESLTKSLETIKKAGDSLKGTQQRGVWQYIFGENA